MKIPEKIFLNVNLDCIASSNVVTVENKCLKNYLTVQAVVCYHVQSNMLIDKLNLYFFKVQLISWQQNPADFNLCF